MPPSTYRAVCVDAGEQLDPPAAAPHIRTFLYNTTDINRTQLRLSDMITHSNAPLPETSPLCFSAARERQRQSALINLPVELVDMIAEEVQLAAATEHGWQDGWIAALWLACSCRFFYELLKTHVFRAIRKDQAPWARQRLVFCDQEATTDPPGCEDGFDKYVEAWRRQSRSKSGVDDPESTDANNASRQVPRWYAIAPSPCSKLRKPVSLSLIEPCRRNREAWFAFFKLFGDEAGDWSRSYCGCSVQEEYVALKGHVLRNHTTKEYLVAEDVVADRSREADFAQTRRYLYGPSVANWNRSRMFIWPPMVNESSCWTEKMQGEESVGFHWHYHALLVVTTFWGKDGHLETGRRGRWAGHRLDIVPVKSTSLDGWANAAEAVQDDMDLVLRYGWNFIGHQDPEAAGL